MIRSPGTPGRGSSELFRKVLNLGSTPSGGTPRAGHRFIDFTSWQRYFKYGLRNCSGTYARNLGPGSRRDLGPFAVRWSCCDLVANAVLSCSCIRGTFGAHLPICPSAHLPALQHLIQQEQIRQQGSHVDRGVKVIDELRADNRPLGRRIS